MSDMAPRNGNGWFRILATLGTVIGLGTTITMGISAAITRAEMAERKAEQAAADLAAYREETAGRLATLETTQEQNVHKVANLDTTLQREMRILDEKTRSEAHEIHKRLQSEMDLKLAPLVDLAKAAQARADLWIPRIVRLETMAADSGRGDGK